MLLGSHTRCKLAFVCPSKYLPADFIEEEARLVEGFEADTLRRSYPVRLVTLTVKLCRRTYHKAGAKMQSVEVCCQYSFTRGRVVGVSEADCWHAWV